MKNIKNFKISKSFLTSHFLSYNYKILYSPHFQQEFERYIINFFLLYLYFFFSHFFIFYRYRNLIFYIFYIIYIYIWSFFKKKKINSCLYFSLFWKWHHLLKISLLSILYVSHQPITTPIFLFIFILSLHLLYNLFYPKTKKLEPMTRKFIPSPSWLSSEFTLSSTTMVIYCQSQVYSMVIDITFYLKGGRLKSPNSQLLY